MGGLAFVSGPDLTQNFTNEEAKFLDVALLRGRKRKRARLVQCESKPFRKRFRFFGVRRSRDTHDRATCVHATRGTVKQKTERVDPRCEFRGCPMTRYTRLGLGATPGDPKRENHDLRPIDRLELD